MSSCYRLTVLSGKGGVGKTLTTINLALAAASQNIKTVVIDGDLGLANLDLLMGIEPKGTIDDVLEGRKELLEITVAVPGSPNDSLWMIPASTGISNMADLSPIKREYLKEQLDLLCEDFSLVIVDAGAGISTNVMQFLENADGVLAVTTPDIHAITDVYAAIKVASQLPENIEAPPDFFLVTNMTRYPSQSESVFQKIASTCKRHLGVALHRAGGVSFDPQIHLAVSTYRNKIPDYSKTLAGQNWNTMARELLPRFTDTISVKPIRKRDSAEVSQADTEDQLNDHAVNDWTKYLCF